MFAFTRRLLGMKNAGPSHRSREAKYCPTIEPLDERVLPAVHAAELCAGLLTVTPAISGVTTIDLQQSGSTIKVLYNAQEFDFAARGVGAIFVNGTASNAGSEIDLLQETNLAMQANGGKGLNNFLVTGSGLTILIGGDGATNNFNGSSGSTLMLGGGGSQSTNNFVAGSGYTEMVTGGGSNSFIAGSGNNLIIVSQGQNNYIDLSQGFSIVIVTDTTGQTFVSADGGSGVVLVTPAANVDTTIDVSAGNYVTLT